MDFSFTERQKAFGGSARDFCERIIAPRVHEIDAAGEIPRDVLGDMASFGLLGMTVSSRYGGSGADFTTAAIAAEEIARADVSMATAVYFLVEAGWGFLLERYGTEGLKEEILPPVTRGESFLGIASTEARGGSDVASVSTAMTRRDERLVVKGTKTYISGAREAERYGGGYVTVVKTDPDLAHRGLSLCYLPVKDVQGIRTSTLEQMGREGISTGVITIENVELPDHYLIGEWNRGFYYAMEGFNCARVLVAAACVGAAGKVLEAGIRHIRSRRAFGSPLASFQGMQFQVAENSVRLETARLLVYKAAWMLDETYSAGRFSPGEINKAAASAKLVAPAAAFDIIKDVLTWHGAYGYLKETGIERALRGVASYLVGAEGGQNVMRIIISREILGKDSVP